MFKNNPLRVLIAAILTLAGFTRTSFAGDVKLSNTLDELVKVNIGGIDQWILIRAEDISKPLLLFVHGGPGSTLMPFSKAFDSELLKNFVVVHWDQRGTGKTFNPTTPQASFTIPQFVDDCIDVMTYLHNRFKQSKLILVAHSWGSIIGTLAAKKRPDLVSMYVGVGQVVDVNKATELSYGHLLQLSKDKKNPELQTALNNLGPPPYTSFDKAMEHSNLILKNGGIFRQVKMNDLGKIIESSPYYTKEDLSRQGEGMKVSHDRLRAALESFNAYKEVPSLSVPVLLIQGHEDWASPEVLVQNYFKKLKTSKSKKIIVMKESGHFPFWDEPKHFADILHKQFK
jgi:pimeloyl-ACP methyl ester carboxylesterase